MSKLEKFFTKKRLILIGVLWVFTNILFHYGPWGMNALEQVSGGKGIPDLMLNYDLNSLYNLFTAYGAEGIRIYKNLQIIDFIYPIFYGALLLGLMVRLKINSNFRVAYTWPFAAVFFDYGENLILRHLINLYPNLTEAQDKLANLASTCTNLKWSFVALSILNIIGFWIWKKFWLKQ